MKDNSVNKLGSIASVVVGISYVVIGITRVLFPSNPGACPMPSRRSCIGIQTKRCC